jgi:hypothetical protein
MRYLKKRSIVWSADFAYAIGLLTSDGCLSNDGRHIDMTSKDLEQLDNFNRALMKNIKISTKQNSSGISAYRVQFSDVVLYDFLISIGLTPRKSHFITDVLVPDSYYADFLRGLFDGDGTCYAYTDKRWASSYMFYTSFASASKSFLSLISEKNARIIGTKSNSIRNSKRVYNLTYGKADSILLYNFMYQKKDCIRLTRKYEKLKDFIDTEKNDKIIQSQKSAQVA